MGVLEDLKVLPKISMASAILTSVALLFQIIGFASPYWYNSDNYHAGLWESCSSGYNFNTRSVAEEVCNQYPAALGWERAVQAFETLGFLALLAAVVVIPLKLFILKDMKILFTARLILLFGAAGCIFLGIIIYGAQSPYKKYGFAFGLCIVAGLISLAAGGTSVVELRGGASTPTTGA